MTTQSALPKYDELQRAFHKAFDPELTAVVDELQMSHNSRVLDVPCGDGFFTRRLARRLRGTGSVIGIDSEQAYLDRATSRTEDESASFLQADVYALPYAEQSFDQVLCAMSFISIEDPVRALREFLRVLTSGGGVAVLESDEYHHVLLTWPVDVEVTVQQAIRDACGGRYSPARKVNRMMRQAGFDSPRKKTFPADRQAPFSDEVVAFLTHYLGFLRGLVRPHLTPTELTRFDRYADPGDAKSLFQRDDAELTCLLTLHQARASV